MWCSLFAFAAAMVFIPDPHLPRSDVDEDPPLERSGLHASSNQLESSSATRTIHLSREVSPTGEVVGGSPIDETADGRGALLQDTRLCDSIILTDLKFSGTRIHDAVWLDSAADWADVFCEFWVDRKRQSGTSINSNNYPSWTGPYDVANKRHRVVIACADSDSNSDDPIGYVEFLPTVSGAGAHYKSHFGENQNFADVGVTGKNGPGYIPSKYNVVFHYAYKCQITTNGKLQDVGVPTVKNLNTRECSKIEKEDECLRYRESWSDYRDSPCAWCCGAKCATWEARCAPTAWLDQNDAWDRKGINARGWDTCDVTPDEDVRYDRSVPGFCHFAEDHLIRGTGDKSRGACRKSCAILEDCGYYTFFIGLYRDTTADVEKNTLCFLYRKGELESDANDYQSPRLTSKENFLHAACYVLCKRFVRDSCRAPCVYNEDGDECESDTRVWYTAPEGVAIRVSTLNNAVCRRLKEEVNVRTVEDCQERCLRSQDCTAINYGENACTFLTCRSDLPPFKKSKRQGYYFAKNRLFGIPPTVSTKFRTKWGDTTQKFLTDGDTTGPAWVSAPSNGMTPDVQIEMYQEYNITAVIITPDCENVDAIKGLLVHVGSDTTAESRCGGAVPNDVCRKSKQSFTLACRGAHGPGLLGTYITLSGKNGKKLRLREVQASGSIPVVLQNIGTECWNGGKCTTAFCEFCGGGKCCRKNFGDTNCVDEGGDSKHICVPTATGDNFGDLSAVNPIGIASGAEATFECTEVGDVPAEAILRQTPPSSVHSRKDCMNFCLSNEFLCGGIRHIQGSLCQLFARDTKISVMEQEVHLNPNPNSVMEQGVHLNPNSNPNSVMEQRVHLSSSDEPKSVVKSVCFLNALDFPSTCNDNFSDSDGNSCTVYAQRKWCTELGSYGDKWKNSQGTFAQYKNARGETALSCTKCGCGTAASRSLTALYSDLEQLSVPDIKRVRVTFTALVTTSPPPENEKKGGTGEGEEKGENAEAGEAEKTPDGKLAPKVESGTNWFLIALIVGGVVLLIGGIVGFVCCRRRATDTEDAEPYY